MLALALKETVRVVLAPGVSPPPFEEKLSQSWVFEAIQLTETPPLFLTVKTWPAGRKGPPWSPDALKPVRGVTTRFAVRAEKLAVTLFGPFIINNEAGFGDPVRSPPQLEKLYPGFGLAETDTLCPLLYQFTPEGLTVPTPDGLTDVVKLY